jgi:hypothetical protein
VVRLEGQLDPSRRKCEARPQRLGYRLPDPMNLSLILVVERTR